MAELGSGSGSSYPVNVDTKQTYQNSASAISDGPKRVDAEFANDVLAAVVQLEAELGANPRGVYADVAARLDALAEHDHDASYDPLGASAAAVAGHVAEADPHPGYVDRLGDGDAQTIYGGANAGGTLWLASTSHLTKGVVATHDPLMFTQWAALPEIYNDRLVNVLGVLTWSGVAVSLSDHTHAVPKLDDAATPDDNTDLDASTSAHGLILKATAPAAGLRNMVAIDNGETVYKNAALFDATAPEKSGPAAAAGSAMTAARRDHVHQGITLIATMTLAEDGTYLYFENIPQTYRSLMLKGWARTAEPTANWDNLLCYFNDDSGANYSFQYLRGQAALVDAAEGLSQSYSIAAQVPTMKTNDLGSGFTMMIDGYSDPNLEKSFYTSGAQVLENINVTSGLSFMFLAGHWNSHSPITKIVLAAYTTRAIKAGSYLELYGIP